MKKCSRCATLKSDNGFYKRASSADGLAPDCKECARRHNSKRKEYAKNKRKEDPSYFKRSNKAYHKRRLDRQGGYAVYYMPEEHYIGISNDTPKRMAQHSKNGKITDGYEIIEVFNNPFDAIILEAEFHRRGYNGCVFIWEE